jgi:hypothetical protein
MLLPDSRTTSTTIYQTSVPAHNGLRQSNFIRSGSPHDQKHRHARACHLSHPRGIIGIFGVSLGAAGMLLPILASLLDFDSHWQQLAIRAGCHPELQTGPRPWGA